MEFRQVKEGLFGLRGISKSEGKLYKDRLLKELQRWAPVDTERLKKSYRVFPLEYQPGKYALVISNTVDYFRFPWHYYKNEIRDRPPKRKYDFVEMAVSRIARQIIKKSK